MIQDIYPKRMDVDFKAKRIEAQDKLIVFREHEILMHVTEESLEFPRCNAFENLDLSKSEDFVFLFTIDTTAFYLYKGMSTHLDNSSVSKWMGKRDLFNLDEAFFGFVAFTAGHLNDWYESNRYCGRCGHEMNRSNTERTIVCPSCSLTKYPQINPVVIVAIHSEDKLLLTKYANSTYDRYALVAGFVEIGESFEDAVRREVFEEVGLKVKNITYYGSQPWGITGGILAGYFAELDGDSTVKLDLDELKEGTWFTIDDMPKVNENEKSLTRTIMYEWYKKQLKG